MGYRQNLFRVFSPLLKSSERVNFPEINPIMKVTALDENNKPVDWWFIYKVPQLGKGAGTDEATGYEYVYYDSTIDGDSDPRQRNVAKSPFLLSGGKGALNFTLNSVFDNFKNPPPTLG